MTAVETRENLLVELLGNAPAAGGTGALARLRASAAQALDGARLPSIKDEAWRFTPLASLLAHRYAPVLTRPADPERAALTRFLVPEADSHRLVFIDGWLSTALSSQEGSCAGLVLGPLSSIEDALLAPHLGAHASLDGDVFAALATRHLVEGAAILVPDDLVCDRPIQLLFVSTGATVSFIAPRILIVAGRNARVTVVQEHVALTESAYFVDAVTEVRVAPNAKVRHVRVQSESRHATHLERLSVSLDRDAAYSLQSVTLGARLSRLDVRVTGYGENMDAELDGLALLAGDQEADTHSTITHAKPNGRSRQLHKMVLDDASHAVFTGKIVVQPHAQLTDSAQSSRALLLSDKARIDTKPELAIEADDVKCAHGAAIGQIDDEQLFYLKTRGLDEGTARDLLTFAFAAEVVSRIPIASLRQQLEEIVLSKTARREAHCREKRDA